MGRLSWCLTPATTGSCTSPTYRTEGRGRPLTKPARPQFPGPPRILRAARAWFPIGASFCLPATSRPRPPPASARGAQATDSRLSSSWLASLGQDQAASLSARAAMGLAELATMLGTRSRSRSELRLPRPLGSSSRGATRRPHRALWIQGTCPPTARCALRWRRARAANRKTRW
jgi:hypothetical protein